jgi:hypothetical protein
MLFRMAMEPLQQLMEKATMQKAISPLHLRVARMRASFYADDVALYLNPKKDDTTVVHQILQLFGDASGPRTSFQKMCGLYHCLCQPGLG